MNKQYRRSRRNIERLSDSNKKRHSAKRAGRAPLVFESLEPRNLMANGWLANVAPLNFNLPVSVASQADRDRPAWSVPIAPEVPLGGTTTGLMNATGVPSASPKTQRAVDGIAANKADAAAVDSLLFEGRDLSSSDSMNTAEGESEPAPDFALIDVNPASATYQRTVSPRNYLGSVSAWLFGYST